VHLVVALPIFRWLMPLPGALKIAVSLVLIAPLAFFMGMPFPLALVRVAAARPALVPWAWGINGCASCAERDPGDPAGDELGIQCGGSDRDWPLCRRRGDASLISI